MASWASGGIRIFHSSVRRRSFGSRVSTEIRSAASVTSTVKLLLKSRSSARSSSSVTAPPLSCWPIQFTVEQESVDRAASKGSVERMILPIIACRSPS